MNLFKGKLTYILAGCAIVYGLVGWGMQWIEMEQALQIVWGGLTALGLRRAIPQ